MNERFNVHMDANDFKEVVSAQMTGLMRGTGIFLLICILPFCSILVIGFDWSDLANPGNWPICITMLCCMILALFAIFHKPVVGLKTRGPIVRQWFATHGAKIDSGSDMAQIYDKDVYSLECDYQVILSDYGYSQVSASGVYNLPWFMLTGKAVRMRNSVVFPVDNGKEDSAVHNLIGFNVFLRKENFDGSLYVPRSVIEQNPSLVSEIKNAVAQSRATYLNSGGADKITADKGFVDWLAATNVVDLRVANNPAGTQPVAAGTPLEDIVFTSNDLFALLGGQDTGVMACTSSRMQWTGENENPSKIDMTKWKRDLIAKFGPAGFVDLEGRPNAELAPVVAALGQTGYAISGCRYQRFYTFSVTWGDQGTVMLDQADPKEPYGGWRIVRHEGPSQTMPEGTLNFIQAHLDPFRPAQIDLHMQFIGQDAFKLSKAVFSGRASRIEHAAKKLGIPTDATNVLKSWVKRSAHINSIFLWDFTECTPDESHGFRNFQYANGNRRQTKMLVDNDAGMVFSRSIVGHPGMTVTFAENKREWIMQAVVVDFYLRTTPDISDLLTTLPIYPGSNS